MEWDEWSSTVEYNKARIIDFNELHTRLTYFLQPKVYPLERATCPRTCLESFGAALIVVYFALY